MHLVLAGPPGYEYETIVNEAHVLEVQNDVTFLGPVSEEAKGALYKGAKAYVSVSSCEGFGLTPLEAAAHGTPSVLSDIPAHREVMGAQAIYVHGNDVQDIARGIQEGLSQTRDREALKKHTEFFSWSQTAKSTWDILTNN